MWAVLELSVSVWDKPLQLPFVGFYFAQDRGNNNSVMSNYEAYKPSTGAMGDRLTAMKAAFQVGSMLGLLFSPENAAPVISERLRVVVVAASLGAVPGGGIRCRHVCTDLPNFVFSCLFALFPFWILHPGVILLRFFPSSGVIAISQKGKQKLFLFSVKINPTIQEFPCLVCACYCVSITTAGM